MLDLLYNGMGIRARVCVSPLSSYLNIISMRMQRASIIIDCNTSKQLSCEGLESLIFHVVMLNKPQPWMERSYSEYTRIWRKMASRGLALVILLLALN